MGELSKIEWTDSTFNPWIGCTNVSPACDHCYAEAMNKHRGWTTWGPYGDRRRTSPANWKKPRAWNADAPRFQAKRGRRQRVFCASLADVFDNQAPAPWRKDLFDLIRETPELDWQILTKRPQNIAKMLPAGWGVGWPNVWLGTTTEDQPRFDQRWQHLRSVPAVVRFLSYEPALGPITLPAGLTPHWIISGGESGPGARVSSPDWFRLMRDQCAEREIAFFHKQFGSYGSHPLVIEMCASIDRAEEADPKSNGKGGALLDGQLSRQFPQLP